MSIEKDIHFITIKKLRLDSTLGHHLLEKLYHGIYKCKEKYLTPKFILVGYKSYSQLCIALRDLYEIHSPIIQQKIGKVTKIFPSIFVEDIEFMGEKLSIVLLEADESLPEDYLEVVPGTQDRYLRKF